MRFAPLYEKTMSDPICVIVQFAVTSDVALSGPDVRLSMLDAIKASTSADVIDTFSHVESVPGIDVVATVARQIASSYVANDPVSYSR